MNVSMLYGGINDSYFLSRNSLFLNDFCNNCCRFSSDFYVFTCFFSNEVFKFVAFLPEDAIRQIAFLPYEKVPEPFCQIPALRYCASGWIILRSYRT